MSNRTEQLEQRLIDFAVKVVEVARQLEKSYEGQHFLKQLVRSGSAPALNYGEARSAESDKDFRHKISLVLKELRETLINLKIVSRANLFIRTPEQLPNLIDENNQLISIFVASHRTVTKKLAIAKRPPPR